MNEELEDLLIKISNALINFVREYDLRDRESDESEKDIRSKINSLEFKIKSLEDQVFIYRKSI